jgi:hypothetical protein
MAKTTLREAGHGSVIYGGAINETKGGLYRLLMHRIKG